MQMLVDAQLPVPQLRRLLAQLLSHEQPQSRSALLCALTAQLAPRYFALCADLMRQEAQQCQVTACSHYVLALQHKALIDMLLLQQISYLVRLAGLKLMLL